MSTIAGHTQKPQLVKAPITRLSERGHLAIGSLLFEIITNEPMMNSATTSIEGSALSGYLSQALYHVEKALSVYLPEVNEDLDTACPARLALAMRYSTLSGGKRLRPILCLMATEACGGDCESALPAACAVEMVHTYSLIHDDLPAMDDDDLRRGRSTCHRAFDEATAILQQEMVFFDASTHLMCWRDTSSSPGQARLALHLRFPGRSIRPFWHGGRSDG